MWTYASTSLRGPHTLRTSDANRLNRFKVSLFKVLFFLSLPVCILAHFSQRLPRGSCIVLGHAHGGQRMAVCWVCERQPCQRKGIKLHHVSCFLVSSPFFCRGYVREAWVWRQRVPLSSGYTKGPIECAATSGAKATSVPRSPPLQLPVVPAHWLAAAKLPVPQAYCFVSLAQSILSLANVI